MQGLGTQVISRLNDINPEDIESIEIIKGPAAATLYGTEAANGVIQIITKRGRAGEPLFNFKVRQGANWFANAAGRIPESFWRNPETNEVETLNIVAREDDLGSPIFRTGYVQGYDLNVSGGADNITYYLGGSYDDEQGAERENELRRVSGRAKLTVTPSDKLDFTGSLGFIRSHTDLTFEASAGGAMWATLYASPRLLRLRDGSPSPLRGFRTATPQVYYDAFSAFQEVSRFTGSLQVNHRPTSWFSHRFTVGTDQTNEDSQDITERSNAYEFFFGTLNGFKEAFRRDVSYNTFDYSGTVTLAVREGLTSNTTVGAQYYDKSTEFVGATGENFPAPGLTVVGAAAIQRGSEDFVENTTVGIFAQQQFGWRDRLFLTGALRADDNSAFGQNFDLVYYPKVSASWVLSEEPFWSLAPISLLKLRAAYGESGQQPDAFDALRTYAAVTGRGDIAAVTPQAIGNPDLGPERGQELELGFDAGFFDQRVGLELTYYNQRTTDAILLRQLAPSFGFPGTQIVNIGEIRNRGVELLLNGQAIDRRNLDLNLSLTFATNANEVVDLGGDLDRIVEFGQFGVESRVGFPVTSFFWPKLVSAEVNAEGRAVNFLCEGGAGSSGPVPCAEAPRTYLGRTTPKYEGAVTSTLTLWDRLRLSAPVDFKQDFSKWDGNTWVRCSIFATCEENAFPQQADPARLAAFQTGLQLQSEYIRDASYTKLRELAATYTVPQPWAQRLGASRAAITVAGRNLYTWTDWPGLDPEATFAGSGWFEQNNLPPLAQFVTSINLSF